MDEGAAPGELELVRGFVNTLDIDGGTEEFASPAGLRRWLLANQLASRKVEVGDAETRRAIALREALRAILVSNNGGPSDTHALDVINAEAARTRPLIRFDLGGGTIQGRADDVDGAVGRLIGIVFTSMARGSWNRLKVCENAACRWAVYDHSKNRSKRWCSMSECGGRAKAREYWRRQHRSTAGTAG
jgi:predicted RNA-binding Zn ribbon-like protein